jgi:hypothetical protein
VTLWSVLAPLVLLVARIVVTTRASWRVRTRVATASFLGFIGFLPLECATAINGEAMTESSVVLGFRPPEVSGQAGFLVPWLVPFLPATTIGGVSYAFVRAGGQNETR